MHRKARLVSPDGTEQEVDLHDIAADSSLAPLLHHQGVLTYLRQKGVPELNQLPVEALDRVSDLAQEPLQGADLAQERLPA